MKKESGVTGVRESRSQEAMILLSDSATPELL